MFKSLHTVLISLYYSALVFRLLLLYYFLFSCSARLSGDWLLGLVVVIVVFVAFVLAARMIRVLCVRLLLLFPARCFRYVGLGLCFG